MNPDPQTEQPTCPHCSQPLVIVRAPDFDGHMCARCCYPTDAPTAADDALQLAITFHNIYERLAPDFGYETRKETREFNPNTPNGKLMVAVCCEIITSHLPRPAPAPATAEETPRTQTALQKGLVNLTQEARTLERELHAATAALADAQKVIADGLQNVVADATCTALFDQMEKIRTDRNAIKAQLADAKRERDDLDAVAVARTAESVKWHERVNAEQAEAIENHRMWEHWQNEAEKALTALASATAERDRLAGEVAWLEKAILNMPDMHITFNDDDCTEDDIGMIPKGWNIRVNSVCVEPLTINAATFREVIATAALATLPKPE